jgi:two-component system phosphate regulon response regulator PhoB
MDYRTSLSPGLADQAVSPGRVLVVEDEESIREMIGVGLERAGYAVSGAGSGEEALDVIRRGHPDLVVLDLMLPGIDGLEVCRRLRTDRETAGIPLIILSARDGEKDIVTGLEYGADDYLTKPFSPGILAARIQAVLRRRERGEPAPDRDTIAAGGIVLDRRRREVLVSGERVDLTFTEFEILWLLAGNPGQVFTRSRIVEGVRGADATITVRAVDVRLVGLRRKLGAAAGSIETVRGVGYRFAD